MNRNLTLALLCITLIVLITLTSAVPYGFTTFEQTVPTLAANEVIPVRDEANNYAGNEPGPVIYRITFDNAYIPRQYVLPRATACFYNSQKRVGTYANTHWQVSSFETPASTFGDTSMPVIQLGREKRTVELTVDKFIRWKHPPQLKGPESAPVPPPMPIPAGAVDYPEGFDTLYLFLIDKDRANSNYISCDNLQPADFAYAKKITIV